MKLLDITLDLRSTKLMKSAQGVAAAGLLEKEEARTLVSMTKGVRLLLEAGNYVLALETLERITEFLEEIDNDLVTTSLRSHVQLIEAVLP